MFFCEANLAARRLLSVTALISLGWSAMAQQTIQFTTPSGKDKDSPNKANNFAPETRSKNPAPFKAPRPLFGDQDTSFDILPGSPQLVFTQRQYSGVAEVFE